MLTALCPCGAEETRPCQARSPGPCRRPGTKGSLLLGRGWTEATRKNKALESAPRLAEGPQADHLTFLPLCLPGWTIQMLVLTYGAFESVRWNDQRAPVWRLMSPWSRGSGPGPSAVWAPRQLASGSGGGRGGEGSFSPQIREQRGSASLSQQAPESPTGAWAHPKPLGPASGPRGRLRAAGCEPRPTPRLTHCL